MLLVGPSLKGSLIDTFLHAMESVEGPKCKNPKCARWSSICGKVTLQREHENPVILIKLTVGLFEANQDASRGAIGFIFFSPWIESNSFVGDLCVRALTYSMWRRGIASVRGQSQEMKEKGSY